MKTRPRNILKAILIYALAAFAWPAVAQDSGGDAPPAEGAEGGETKPVEDYKPDAGDKSAAEIKAENPLEKSKQKSISEEEGSGPRLNLNQNSSNVAVTQTGEIKKITQVTGKLKKLTMAMPDDDESKAGLLDRLALEYFKLARANDDAAFELLDQATIAEQEGNATTAEDLKRRKEQHDKEATKARKQAEETLLVIVQDHSYYAEMDKVLFYLSYIFMQNSEGDKASKVFTKLLREYPDSKYAPDAKLALGDLAFAEEDIQRALEEYNFVAREFQDTPSAGYAMYRMGWCYFNLGEPSKALQQFENVISYSEKTGNKSLAKEALKDLVKAYSMWDQGDPRKARGYFKKFAGKDKDQLDGMMERLARFYSESGETKRAIFVFGDLIKNNRNSFKVVKYQTEIMYAVEAFQKPGETAKAIALTVKLFKKASTDKKYATDRTPEKVQETYLVIEEYTRETAKWYHKVALSTKNPLYFALAYELYKIYVENFEDAQNEELYEILFYYAELLYWKAKFSTKDDATKASLYAEAAKRYDQVIIINAEGEHSKDSAHGAVLSYDKLTKMVSKECPATPQAPKNEKKLADFLQKKFDIPDCRVNFVAAADRFLKVAPADENAVDIEYYAARVYYDYNHFESAIERFGVLSRTRSSHNLGVLSAQLLLDSLLILEKYKEMYTWVKEMEKNPDLNQGELGDTLAYLAVTLSFQFCQEEEEKKNWVVAAECYEKFQVEYSDSQDAPSALWNAAIDWENASDLSRAIDVRLHLIRTYNDSDDPEIQALSSKALYRIGQNYHGMATYSEAARFYEIYADAYRSTDEAPTALANAAVFRNGLGEVEKAIQDYDTYIGRYPDDKRLIEEMSFDTGEIYFNRGMYREAIERFDAFRKEYRKSHKRANPLNLINSDLMIAKCYQKLGVVPAMMRFVGKVEEKYDNRGFQRWLKKTDEESSYAANEVMAEARFIRAEMLFKEAMEIQLFEEGKASESSLQRALDKKTKLMNKAVPIYMEVLEKYKSSNWGLSSLCRVGMMFHDIALQLQNAPIPERLTEDQKLIYEEMLFDVSLGIEDRAVEHYVIALKEAARLGWFNEYTSLARRRLYELRPQEYRSASEIMVQPNNIPVVWQHAEIFDDIEVAAGRKKTKTRTKKTLSEEDLKKDDAAPAEGQPTEGGGGEAPASP